MSAWWPRVVELERRGRVQDSELGDPKYDRAIWKLTGTPRPIFQGAGVSSIRDWVALGSPHEPQNSVREVSRGCSRSCGVAGMGCLHHPEG